MKKLVIIAVFLLNAFCLWGGERIVFADEKLSVELPDGWKKSDRNQGKVMTGWESPDATTSVFFQKMNASNALSMQGILDGILDSFDENEAITFGEVSKFKTGQVNGVGEKKFPAIFTVLDATLESIPKDFDLKFYLFVFDTGTAQYFIQASSTKPVWDVRERQILSLIRSLIARK